MSGKIVAVVEGHGEVTAVPVLLRRLLAEMQRWEIDVEEPIRRTASELRTKEGVEVAVKLAQMRGASALLSLFDDEDGCPVQTAAETRSWAEPVAGSLPLEVAIAYREYETWFLAGLESLRGKCEIAHDAEAPSARETQRDAKSALEAFMPKDRAYKETQDQVKLTANLDLKLVHARSRCFVKLVKAAGVLVDRLDPLEVPWPPQDWAKPEA